jgi:hypothetical protein
MSIKSIYIFRIFNAYGGSLIIIETNQLPSLMNTPSDYEDEEISYYKEHIIKRSELDTGWAKIGNNRVKLSLDDTKYIIRTLKQTVFFLSPHYGPQMENADLYDEIYKDYVEKKISIADNIEKLKRIKRCREVKMLE